MSWPAAIIQWPFCLTALMTAGAPADLQAKRLARVPWAMRRTTASPLAGLADPPPRPAVQACGIGAQPHLFGRFPWPNPPNTQNR